MKQCELNAAIPFYEADLAGALQGPQQILDCLEPAKLLETGLRIRQCLQIVDLPDIADVRIGNIKRPPGGPASRRMLDPSLKIGFQEGFIGFWGGRSQRSEAPRFSKTTPEALAITSSSGLLESSILSICSSASVLKDCQWRGKRSKWNSSWALLR